LEGEVDKVFYMSLRRGPEGIPVQQSPLSRLGVAGYDKRLFHAVESRRQTLRIGVLSPDYLSAGKRGNPARITSHQTQKVAFCGQQPGHSAACVSGGSRYQNQAHRMKKGRRTIVIGIPTVPDGAGCP
jgi:hypothetical protein